MEEFVLYTLEPQILHTFEYRTAEIAAPETAAVEISPHGGIDESGKGDFFGPLVIGGVFTAGYLINFVILRMEDFALLTGTIILAVILAIIMMLTGKINRNQNDVKR